MTKGYQCRELVLRAPRRRAGARQSGRRAGPHPVRHAYPHPGFEPGWIYELVYTGRDPLVLGLGHAAVRDFISFLRYPAEDDTGLGTIERAYAWGRSQTGRCMRDFVYRGFNAEVAGRRRLHGL